MKYYSNGKLLLTGEYLVLDGAKSLALPTIYGQDLTVKSNPNKKAILNWESYDLNGKVWFYGKFRLSSLQIISTSNDKIALTLQNILLEARSANPNFLQTTNEIQVATTLNFDRNWGLGTSSTLINNIASWAKIDAFELQFKIFGGSAYDIACAQNSIPIIYQLDKGKPQIEKIKFNPKFKDNLFFIYLNQKQNSRNSIAQFNKITSNKNNAITEISEITNKIIHNNSFSEFEYLLKKHEEIISKVIGLKPIKEKLFDDYFGQIKSLGAWGGDFILATGNDTTPQYFKNKGYQTVIPYSKMIL